MFARYQDTITQLTHRTHQREPAAQATYHLSPLANAGGSKRIVGTLWAIIMSSIAACAFTSLTFAQAGGTYNLSWNTMDGGGTTFNAGGNYALGGTIGQTDATTQVMIGGNYIVKGGFWVGTARIKVPADLDQDGDVDEADFDIFQICATGPALAGPLNTGCSQAWFDIADLDSDSDVDTDDFAIFQRCWSGQSAADPACTD